MRKTTAIMIYNSDKKLLMQKRDDIPNIINPGKWSTFGGELENDEKPLECAIREAEEEVNYKMENPKLIGSFDHQGGTIFVIIDKFNEDKISDIELNEGEDWGWFKIDEARELDYGSHNKDYGILFDMIEKYFEELE